MPPLNAPLPVRHLASMLGDTQAGSPAAQIAEAISYYALDGPGLPGWPSRMLQNMCDDMNNAPLNGSKLMGQMLCEYNIFQQYVMHKGKAVAWLYAWVRVTQANVDEDNMPLPQLLHGSITKHVPDKQPKTPQGLYNQVKWVKQTMADIESRGGFCTRCETMEPPRKRLRLYTKMLCGQCALQSNVNGA